MAIKIYGDNVRFQEHQKTCDTLNSHNNIGPITATDTNFLTKMQ